jgi:hypothetical protein
MTGSNAAVGEQFKAGAEQAASDINAKGGISTCFPSSRTSVSPLSTTRRLTVLVLPAKSKRTCERPEFRRFSLRASPSERRTSPSSYQK